MLHTHLPEANYPDEDHSTQVYSAPVTQIEEYDDQEVGDGHQSLLEEGDRLAFSSQGLPLSPATSESSGPHSPTTTGFGGHPHSIGMLPSNMLPQESPIDSKPVPVPGYYAPPFTTAEKNTGYWAEMPTMTQFGY